MCSRSEVHELGKEETMLGLFIIYLKLCFSARFLVASYDRDLPHETKKCDFWCLATGGQFKVRA